MEATALLSVLGSATVGGVFVAIIQAFSNRRRLSAEATEIITRAASGVVERLESEILSKTAMVTTLERAVKDERADRVQVERRLSDRIAALEDEIHRSRHTNQIHAAWDYMANAELRSHGSLLPEPPPLYPPPDSRVAPRPVQEE